MSQYIMFPHQHPQSVNAHQFLHCNIRGSNQTTFHRSPNLFRPGEFCNWCDYQVWSKSDCFVRDMHGNQRYVAAFWPGDSCNWCDYQVWSKPDGFARDIHGNQKYVAANNKWNWPLNAYTFMFSLLTLASDRLPGPCLNIKTIFPRYIRDKTVARPSYL